MIFKNNIYCYTDNDYLERYIDCLSGELKPNELITQKLIEQHAIGFLNGSDNHGINFSLSKCKKKLSLNYDQIDAKDNNPYAKECRGLILAREDLSEFPVLENGKIDPSFTGKTIIVAFGMMRFFNYGQGEAYKIDWDNMNLSVQDKADGTCCFVYFDPTSKQWHVGTRAAPEADIPIDDTYTFRTLFEEGVKSTLGLSFDEFTASLVREMTYVFELTSPYNRIIVDYTDIKITLLAVRYLPTLKEEDPSQLALVQAGGVPVIQKFEFKDRDSLFDFVGKQEALKNEGVVVCDAEFNRVKIKNPQYLAFHRLKGRVGNSKRNLLELILLGHEDDLIPYLTEREKSTILDIKGRLVLFVSMYNQLYSSYINIYNSLEVKSKKDFALMLVDGKVKYTAPMFAMFDGKCSSMKEFIDMNSKNNTWGNGFLDKLLNVMGFEI